MSAPSSHPVDVGTRTETILLAEFVKRGYEVLLPWSVNCRYDMALDLGDRILKVQCKTGRLVRGCVVFSTISVRSNTKVRQRRGYAGEVDLFGVHCPQIERSFVVPARELPASQVSLRLRPAANGQRDGVRWAAEYDIARLAQLVEHEICNFGGAGSSPAAGLEVEESPLFGFVDERVRHVRWTEEAVIESVARWLEQLAPDAPRTQKAYLAWSIGHPDRAAPSTIGNFGGFVGVRMAAERLLAERAAAA